MPWGGVVERVDSLRVGDGSVDPGANNLDVAGTGRVRGNTTLDGTLSLAGNATLSGTLTVTGQSTLGALLVRGAAYFSQPAYFSTGAGQPVFSGGFGIAGNPSGVAGQVAPTRDVDSRGNSTGRAFLMLPGTIKLSQPAWWKVFSGTTAYYLPAFTDLYSTA